MAAPVYLGVFWHSDFELDPNWQCSSISVTAMNNIDHQNTNLRSDDKYARQVTVTLDFQTLDVRYGQPTVSLLIFVITYNYLFAVSLYTRPAVCIASFLFIIHDCAVIDISLLLLFISTQHEKHECLPSRVNAINVKWTYRSVLSP